MITINYQLWAINVLPSLRYFFKLRAEHIHGPVDVEVASQRDVKPVPATMNFVSPNGEDDFSCTVAKMPSIGTANLNCHNAQAGGVRQINLPYCYKPD